MSSISSDSNVLTKAIAEITVWQITTEKSEMARKVQP